MHGLHSAAQRLAQPTRPGFKAGGLIRGPGTGTSDSIPTEVPEGTFIMPADSTRTLGLAAEALGGGVPINVSNGEFQVSPDQVQQIGASVLDILRGVTHKPADEGRHELLNYADGGVVDYGVPLDEQVIPVNRAIAEAEANAQQRDEEAEAQFQAVEANRQPPVGFADGGMVTDVTRVGNSYSGGNVGGNVTVNGQAPGGTFSQVATAAQAPTPVSTPVPARTALASAPTPPAVGAAAPAAAAAVAPPAPAPMGWAERNAQRNLAVTASSIVPSQERSAAQARLATLPTPGVAAPAALSAAPVMPQPAPGVQSASQRLGSPSALPGQSVSTYQPRNYADGGVVEDERRNALIAQIPVGGPAVWTGGGQAAAALSAPAPAQVAPLSPPPPAGALTRAASYAPPEPVASPAAQALSAPAFSMQPSQPVSAQSMDAASGLARRGAADVLSTMPTAQQPGVQAPPIRHSDNDWAARKALENAATAASSITKNGSRFDRTRGNNAQSFAYRDALETDNALKSSAPALAQQAMREQGDTLRTRLQAEAAASTAAADRTSALERTLISERGANSRAGITAMGGLEEARIKAATDNKAPAGYRWAPGGKLEAIPGGPAADGKALTEDQAKSAGYALRMDNALKLIDEIGREKPSAIRPGALTALTNALPETVANSLRPEARQRVESAQLDALDAALTLNTGAAYTREQLQGLSRSYFAQPGDDDKTVADKSNRLQSLIDTARLRAGEKGSAMTDAAQAKNAARSSASSGKPASAGQVPDDVGALLKKYGG